jgi:hypothetical protein
MERNQTPPIGNRVLSAGQWLTYTLGAARNPVICERRVADIRAVQPGHVARNTVILPANGGWTVAILISVALQAALSEVAHLGGDAGNFMWIVACDAPHLTLARTVTSTLVHLLDLTANPVFSRAVSLD